MKRNLDTRTDLPAFESELRAVSYYNGLTEVLKEGLSDKKLRTINGLKDITHLEKNWTKLFTVHSKNTQLWSGVYWGGLRKYFEKKWTTDWWGNYTLKNDKIIGLELFEPESIVIEWKKIYLKVLKEWGIYEGDILWYLENGIKALQVSSKSSMPKWAYIYGQPQERMNNWTFTFEMQEWEALVIGKNNNDSVIINSMAARWYDILPTSWDVSHDSIALLKRDKLEFYSLTVEHTDDQSIKATPIEFYWIREVDYSKHWELVEWFLDRKRNFIIGIFEVGWKKMLKIIRIDQEATLMDEYENIVGLEGLEHADVAGYDLEGRLRLIDGNFENYELYTREEIFTSMVESFEWAMVPGWCETPEEIFKSDDYKRWLLYVLWDANPLLNKARLTDIISRIHNWDLILKSELDNLLHICDPEWQFNEWLINKATRIIETLSSKHRKDPLRALIDDPKPLLSAYAEYLLKYSNCIVWESIVSYGKDLRVVKDGEKMWVYVVWYEDHEVLCALDEQDILVDHYWSGYSIAIKNWSQIQNIIYEDGKWIVDKSYSNDLYYGTPSFDAQGNWVARLADMGSYRFVYEEWESVKEHEIGDFRWFKEVDNFYVIDREDGSSDIVFLWEKWSYTLWQWIDKKLFAKRRSISDWFVTLSLKEDNSLVVLVCNTQKNTIEEHVIIDEVSEDMNVQSFADKLHREWWILLEKEDEAIQLLKVTDQWEIISTSDFYDPFYMNFSVGIVWKKEWFESENIDVEEFTEASVESVYSWPFIAKAVIEWFSALLIAWENNAVRILHYGADWIRYVWIEELKKYKRSKDEFVQYAIIEWWSHNEKYVYLQYAYDGDKLTWMTYCPYESISEEHIYGDTTYRAFKHDGKYWLLEINDWKSSIYAEATEEKEPVFGSEGFSFGKKEFIVSSDGELSELEHDFDSLEVLEWTKFYLWDKEGKYSLAMLVGRSLTNVNVWEIVSKPSSYDWLYLVVETSQWGVIYMIDTVDEAWNMQTLGWLPWYAVVPMYVWDWLFSIESDGWFYLLWEYTNYKPLTKYTGRADQYSSRKWNRGYVRLINDSWRFERVRTVYSMHKEQWFVLQNDKKNPFSSIDTITKFSKFSLLTWTSEIWSWLYLMKDWITESITEPGVYMISKLGKYNDVGVLSYFYGMYNRNSSDANYALVKIDIDDEWYPTVYASKKSYKAKAINTNEIRKNGTVIEEWKIFDSEVKWTPVDISPIFM